MDQLQERTAQVIAQLPGDLPPHQQAAIHTYLDAIEAIAQGDTAITGGHALSRVDTAHRYTALFEKNNDGVFIISLEGTHLVVNQQAADMLGYSVEELLNRSMDHFIVEEEHESSHATMARLLAGETLPIYQRQFRRKDGAIITVELNVALVRDEAGKPLHFQSIMRDVTLRQNMYDTLLERRRKLQMVIEAMPNALLVTDKDCILLSFFAPSSFPAIWETDSSPIGKPAYQLLPEGLGRMLEGHLNITDDHAYPATFEHQFMHEGAPLYVEVTVNLVPEADEFLITIHDATSLRQAALELSSMEERQRIARDLHDGATQHLSAAALMMDVLPRLFEKNPQQALGKLDTVRQLVRAAFAEMRMLLQELRPDSLAHTPLPELVEHLINSSVLTLEGHITLKVTGAPWALPPETNITLYRIIQEAINNIVKHANATHATVDLAFTAHHLQVTIRDDGDGFTAEHIPGGHFGLNFMGERAEAAHLTYHIHSEIGHGTTITVRYNKEQTRD